MWLSGQSRVGRTARRGPRALCCLGDALRDGLRWLPGNTCPTAQQLHTVLVLPGCSPPSVSISIPDLGPRLAPPALWPGAQLASPNVTVNLGRWPGGGLLQGRKYFKYLPRGTQRMSNKWELDDDEEEGRDGEGLAVIRLLQEGTGACARDPGETQTGPMR